MITKKTLSALFALSVCQATYANDCCTPCYKSGEPIQCELPPGIIYPGEYEIDPDLYVSAEFIYWKAQKAGNNYIAYNRNIVGTETDNTLIYHDAGYKPGFRIDAGLGLPCWDHWIVNAAYTWFHHETITNKSAKPGDVITAPGGTTLPAFTATSVHSKFRFNLDMLETSLGRPMYTNERMILNAYFGLKGFWYHQDQMISYAITNAIAGSNNNVAETAHVWGIGPYGGLDAKGLLCYGVYLTGKFELLAAYTKYSKSEQTQDFTFGATNTHTKAVRNDFYGDWPWIDASLGLGWGTYFGCNCDYHIDIVAAYEFIVQYAAALPGNTFTPREMYMEGFTLKGQFNF